MKNFLQNVFSITLEDKFSKGKNFFLEIINKHPEISSLLLLTVSCLFFLFFGLNFYPLIDVDETRYAVMARDLYNSFDWNSLMLNSAPFLEKPPLFFWIVATFIKLFKEFTSWSVRFPIALLTSGLIFFTYYVGKRIISRKFGIISALTLLSSIFFLILSHIAIIDMVLTVFMTSAIYCGFLTHFCKYENKKYYWWYFYLFIGLAFLAKGILGLAIPLTIMFVYNLVTKTLKDFFKPLNLIPGLIIFIVMVTPWHLIMYKEYGFQFIKEYFLIHHFGRFMGSEYIGRERPFLYFIPVFLLGFLPWTFMFIAALVEGCKTLIDKYTSTQGKIKEKISALFETSTNEQKLLVFFTINFVIIFTLFSSSSTKLPTYILPVFPAASFLTGYYWWFSDEKAKNEKTIYNLTLLLAAIFTFSAMIATVAFFFLPYEIQYKLDSFQQFVIVSVYLISILLLLRLNTKRALSIFGAYVFSMSLIISLAVGKIFNFIYSTGQNEIVEYSKMSVRPINKSQFITFDFAVKPSALLYHPEYIYFITSPDFKTLDNILTYKGGPTFVIIKNKNMHNNENYSKEIQKRLELVKMGERYSLYVKDVNNEYNNNIDKLSIQTFKL